jgi:hypothetical protein
VPLSTTEIAALDHQENNLVQEPSVSSKVVERIIIGNTAKDSAVQLLGPVGEDLWINISVRTENNTACDQAVQVAYHVQPDIFKYLLDRQDRIIAQGR